MRHHVVLFFYPCIVPCVTTSWSREPDRARLRCAGRCLSHCQDNASSSGERGTEARERGTTAKEKEKRRREERRQERPMHRESRRIQAGTSQCVCACAHTHTYQQTCTRLFRQAGKPTHRRTRMQGRLQGFARTRWHIEQLVPGRHPRAYAERSVHRRSHRS